MKSFNTTFYSYFLRVVCLLLGSLSNRRRRQQSQQAVKIFWHDPSVFLSMYLLWLQCLFLFSLKFSCFQRLFLNKNIDDNSWNIDQVLQTTWKWSNWRLTREHDGMNIRFISRIHVCFLSCVISFIVLPTLPSSSLDVLLKLPITRHDWQEECARWKSLIWKQIHKCKTAHWVTWWTLFPSHLV